MINCEHSSRLSSSVFYLSCSQSKTYKPQSEPIRNSARGLGLDTRQWQGGRRGASLRQGFFPKPAALVNSWSCLPVPQGNGPSILWSLTSRY